MTRGAAPRGGLAGAAVAGSGPATTSPAPAPPCSAAGPSRTGPTTTWRTWPRCWSGVDLLAAEADRPDAVRLAAWFHDAVYDPTAADNEERSAQLAETTLTRLRLAPDLVDEVARLVRLTATHDVADDDRDGAVLCDADLAVLASDDLRYSAYVEGVRREYAHVDDDAFAAGRAAVLRRLLDRPALFRTAHGRSAWEQRARANVTAELARLRAP